MKIEYHRQFLKSFKRLDKKMQVKVIDVVEVFKNDPYSPRLKNHALKGAMKGQRAFSVSGDCRVIFEEFEDYFLVILLDVGSHSQVY